MNAFYSPPRSPIEPRIDPHTCPRALVRDPYILAERLHHDIIEIYAVRGVVYDVDLTRLGWTPRQIASFRLDFEIGRTL